MMSLKCLFCSLMVFIVLFCTTAPAAEKVIEWKFDGNLNDTSGNDLHANPYPNASAILYAEGVSGQALVSDANDCAYRTDISTALLPVLGTDTWSVNLWIYPTQMPLDWRLAWCLGQKPTGSGNSRSLYSSGYSSGSGKITFVGNKPDVDPVYTVSSIPWDINQWQMITTTYDGSIVRIYRNGVLIAMRAQTFQDAPGEVRVPSNAWNNSNFFIGRFDEFTVWRGALTQQEILNLVIPGVLPPVQLNQQVVYYKMEDPTGSTMPDHSGSGNDGQLGGYTLPLSDWLAAGIHGEALLFDGQQEIIPPVSVSQPVNYTISFWFKSGLQPYTSAFYCEKQVSTPAGGYGKGTQLIIRANNDELQVFSKERDFNTLFSFSADASAYLDGVTWHHLAVVADGEAAKTTLYVDGQVLAAGDYKNSSHKTTELDVSIGYSWPDDDYIGMWGPTYLDEVKIWNGALTPAQVQAIAAPSNFVNDLKVDLQDFAFMAEDWMLNYQTYAGETLIVDDMEGTLDSWSVYNGSYSGTGTITQTTNAYAGNGALRWNYILPDSSPDPNNYTSIVYDFGEVKDLAVYDHISLWLYRHTGNSAEDLIYLKFINADMQVKAEEWITGDSSTVDPNDQWAAWNIDPNSLLGPYGQGTADQNDLRDIRYLMIGTGSSDTTNARSGTIDIDELMFVADPECSGRPGADLNWDCKMDLQDILYLFEDWLLGNE